MGNTTQNQSWYSRNKAKHVANVKRNNELYRQWYNSLREGLSCKECGFSHPAALDFHHRNPTEKVESVSFMASKLRSKESILAEIAKCDVLCRNCHAIHHYDMRQSSNG